MNYKLSQATFFRDANLQSPELSKYHGQSIHDIALMLTQDFSPNSGLNWYLASEQDTLNTGVERRRNSLNAPIHLVALLTQTTVSFADILLAKSGDGDINIVFVPCLFEYPSASEVCNVAVVAIWEMLSSGQINFSDHYNISSIHVLAIESLLQSKM